MHANYIIIKLIIYLYPPRARTAPSYGNVSAGKIIEMANTFVLELIILNYFLFFFCSELHAKNNLKAIQVNYKSLTGQLIYKKKRITQ